MPQLLCWMFALFSATLLTLLLISSATNSPNRKWASCCIDVWWWVKNSTFHLQTKKDKEDPTSACFSFIIHDIWTCEQFYCMFITYHVNVKYQVRFISKDTKFRWTEYEKRDLVVYINLSYFWLTQTPYYKISRYCLKSVKGFSFEFKW